MTQELYEYVHIQFVNSGTPEGTRGLLIISSRLKSVTEHLINPLPRLVRALKNNLGSEMLLTVCCVRLSQCPLCTVVASGRLSASRIQPHHGIEISDIGTLIGL